jgi:hypothetical protein
VAEFDAFLVFNTVGTHRKFRRLTPPERWCAIAGVWAIASMSPIRGYLLISRGVQATDDDFAEQAGVSIPVARSCLRKMRGLGLVEHDEELDAEHVHDWHEHQPERRVKPSDSTEAWRERKRRQRARDNAGDVTPSHANVPRDMSRPKSRGHAPEVEGEVERELKNPPSPPASGGRRRDRDRFAGLMAAWREAAVASDAEHERWRTALESTPDHVRGSLQHLHAHASPNGRLLLGCGSGGFAAGYVEERFGTLLAAVIDGPYELVDCGCAIGGAS